MKLTLKEKLVIQSTFQYLLLEEMNVWEEIS